MKPVSSDVLWRLIVAVTLVGCAASSFGATEAQLSRARQAEPEGAKLFQQACASCHGERGESASGAPPILGEGALPEYPRAQSANANPASGDPESLRLQAQSRPLGAPRRDPFRTAQDLFDYISRNTPLPKKKAGTLSNEEYWSLLNFMLLAHGVELPSEGVTQENASTVKL